MRLHDTVERLNQAVRRKMSTLWERHEDGDLTFNEFQALGSAVIARAAEQARAIGDLTVAAQLTVLNRQIEVPTGDGLDDDLPSEASEAIDDQTETQSFGVDPAAAMGVAGAAVVMIALQDSIREAMKTNRVEFYSRTANPDACEICADMAGVVLPSSDDFYHHKGCMCVPTIIIHTK